MFARWYGRLGPRYPRLLLATALRLEYLIVVGGTAGLALYVQMSLDEFALLALASIAGQEFYAFLTLRYFRPRLTVVAAWIGGERRPESAASAWRAAASAPYELLRLWWRGGYPLVAGLGWCLFATWLLGLAAWSVPVLYLAAVVVIAYGNGLAFLVFERAMQPVLDDIAVNLSDEVEIDAVSLPLKRRLLSAVPAIGAGVGVFVVGLVSDGHPGIDTLLLASVASLGIAMTFAFAFTILLADSVARPIHRLEQATTRVGGGDLGTRLPVSSADEIGTLTRAFNRMLSGLQERERLREAFGTFVDPALADRVARDGVDFRGQEIEVSILFMDVRGFTTFAETAPPREVVARLNELYELVVPVITGNGGHANKFIGDGLLAVFGAPERLDDHADRAVAAAIDIAECVRDRFRGDLAVGLGVNSGTVVVGTIGGGGRLDFTVIGDVVNTAARVESATRTTGDEVLITASTHRLLGSSGGWEQRPALPLKGKSEQVELFAPPRRSPVAR